MGEGLVPLLRLVGVTLGFPLVAWFFGWSVLGRLTRLDAEERFAASWGVGFAFLALGQFLAFLLRAPQPWFNLSTLGLMLLTALLCRGRKEPQAAAASPCLWLLVACSALGYLHLVCIQALLPVYRGSAWYFDWWMHYDEALVFVGERGPEAMWADYSLASRTPLFNLACASVLAVAGHDFWVFQLAAALTNGCFIPAAYLLLRDLFGGRAARLGVALAPLNLWMLHNAWFTWPKMLAAYFVLLALYFYLRFLRARPADPGQGSRLFLYFWVSALLAFMTHQASLVFFGPLLLHAAVLALARREYRPGVRDFVAMAVALGLIVGPWYTWLASGFGLKKILRSTPVTLGDQAATFRAREIVHWVGYNLVTSVVPCHLIAFAFAGPYEFEPFYRGATTLYFSLLTGAVTVSLTLFLLARLAVAGYALWRRARGMAAPTPGTPPEEGRSGDAGWREWTAVWLFVGLGVLGAAVLHPGKMDHGIAHAAFVPAVVLLAALGWGVLSRANRWVAAAVCAGMVAEFVLMFWSHWWFLTRAPEVLEELPGNQFYKEDAGVVFLNDWLGDGQYVFLAGAAVIQVALVVVLFRVVLRRVRVGQALPDGGEESGKA
jgi:hypothetical protein